MIQTIQNELLTVQIDSMGAELQSIQDNAKTEYLWEGNKKFWGRRSPVLFPFVGSLKEKRYCHHGIEYPMNQHGFARDMEFTLLEYKPSNCWYQLCSNENTKRVYPFDFELRVGYCLSERKLQVLWEVKNSGKDTMYFSIGAHPAFCCPLIGQNESCSAGLKERGEKRKNYFLEFEKIKELKVSMIDETNGLLLSKTKSILLSDGENASQNGFLAIGDHLFDKDALVIEHNQTKKVSLCTSDKKAYLSVSFDAPLFGVWSPKEKEGMIPPFVCIEPWYGRCDSIDFSGELSQREWGNQLEAGEEFKTKYEIEILST